MESAPRRIRPLAPHLANQIAAGEVVERPASVVKELVENSLDAGADQLQIEAEEGGVRLLRVRDNGWGIHHDDLLLALSRHATSKLTTPRDLLGITSLGFRGEALASVASVSRLRLTSRAVDCENSWTVTGDSDAPAPAPHPVGTTVEIRDLFYNVPARRKFLRAERTEYEHLEDVVRRLALGRFATGFTLRHNGRQVFSVAPAKDQIGSERRLRVLLGRPFLENAAVIDFAAAGLRLHGWLGVRGYTRSQADVQYVYLNGRAIRDRVVNHALRQVFSDVLQTGRFPAYVLNLDMDPTQVDVNVHPTKHEVRFREARLVHDFLVSAVRSALGEASHWVPRQPTTEAPVAEGHVTYGVSTDRMGAGADSEPRARSMSLIADRFLLSESEHGVVVVDGLRLVQDEVHHSLVAARSRGLVGTRPLLMPVTVRVGAKGVRSAENCEDRLRALGVDLHAVSAETLRIVGVPDIEANFDVTRLVTLLIEACEGGVEEEALLDACAQGAQVPSGSAERRALALRGEQRAGFSLELDAQRLAQLIKAGR